MLQCVKSRMRQWENVGMGECGNGGKRECFNGIMHECVNGRMLECMNAGMWEGEDAGRRCRFILCALYCTFRSFVVNRYVEAILVASRPSQRKAPPYGCIPSLKFCQLAIASNCHCNWPLFPNACENKSMGECFNRRIWECLMGEGLNA